MLSQRKPLQLSLNGLVQRSGDGVEPEKLWTPVPQNPAYWSNRGDVESFRHAFYRASYLCKADMKNWILRRLA